MADTQINQELRDFMQKNNLDPFNHYAYAELFRKQQEQIDEIARRILTGKGIDNDGIIIASTLYDDFNEK